MSERTRNFWYVSGGFFMFVGVMGFMFELSDALPHGLHQADYFGFPINVALALLGFRLFTKFKPTVR